MTNTTTPATQDGLVERIVNSLRACLMGTDEAADQWTFAGMQDAFFRWPVVERELRHVLAALTTKADAAGEGVEPKATTEQERAWAEAIMRANMALYLVEPPMRADIDAGLKAALEWAASRTPSQAIDAAGQELPDDH